MAGVGMAVGSFGNGGSGENDGAAEYEWDVYVVECCECCWLCPLRETVTAEEGMDE